MHVLPRVADVVLRITSLSLPYSERFLVDGRDVDVVLGVFGVQRDEMRGQLPVQRLDRLVQDEHLRRLAQACTDQFTPPAPLPLDEQ